jgi:ATP-dependent DNA helicase RecQ
MAEKLESILANVFGYSSFRLQQKEIIEYILDDKDALVIMPTGGGKSICYQLPALAKDGFAIVVSPLIALMNDQVSALRALGVKAYALNSHISYEEKLEINDVVNNGGIKLLYISPERLLSENYIDFLKTKNISLIAIDEAHCVSVWGNDFRPDYIALNVLKSSFPRVPLVALTATADSATQSDIKKQLKIEEAQTFISSFERSNITVESRPGQQRVQQIINWAIQHKDQAGIIYCLSRKNTESIAEKLKAQGFNAAYYHAGMDGAERSRIQKAFTDDEIDIVCATIAFGMGIDKPNIRYVIHYSMPKNIEGYYQEIGRAGRDGEPSKALLFYSWGDFLNLQKFIDESPSDPIFKEVQKAKLDRMWAYANSKSCRTNFVLNYFGEYKYEPCDHCDNCKFPPKYIDGTTYAKMLISGIIRTHQRLNMALLVDMLRGSYRKEIIDLQLDKVKTYGVGREIPQAHWLQYITQMINQGIVQLDFSDASRLKLTPLSKKVLQDEIKVQLAEYEKYDNKKAKVKVQKLEVDLSDMDNLLYKRLKVWRSRKAKEKNYPAYVILHDKSLKQIASSKPRNKKELLRVEGIGKQKIEDYGDEIISIIQD